MSKPVTHNCRQGSAEWLALRAKYFTASEAPAMMGVSKYQSRSALLKAKAAGIAPEVDADTQRRFDMGHEAEAKARPIAEALMNEELYPVTMSLEVDGLPLLASLDGITMDGATTWECKLSSEVTRRIADTEEFPLEYACQLEQQLLVSGAERCYFTASDGTESGTFGAYYEPDLELRAKLIAGWKQFAEDLANYQHIEQKPAVVADAIEDLPALTVQLVGQVTASNLESFEVAVKARIQAISTELVTDADFANADKMVKFLDDGEKRLDMVKAQALAQTASIDQLFRTIDSLKAEMRSKRLTLDKLVKAEKENRKGEIVTAANRELSSHLVALQGRAGVLVNVSGNFADAIKGLKSLDSMRDKVSVALANAKIEADAMADRIDANRKAMGEHASLFPDFATVCTKAPDDFAALVAMRVQQQREADEKRLAAERENIRAEEEARAKREAEQKFAEQHAAFNEQQGKAEAAAVREMLYPKHDDAGKTMNLGQINAALGFTVTADFLSRLGINPVRQEKAAKLYEAAKMATICRRIQEHLTNVMQQALGGKAAAECRVTINGANAGDLPPRSPTPASSPTNFHHDKE